jgi:hypothetical protein
METGPGFDDVDFGASTGLAGGAGGPTAEVIVGIFGDVAG